jgi:hypothetical protein
VSDREETQRTSPVFRIRGRKLLQQDGLADYLNPSHLSSNLIQAVPSRGSNLAGFLLVFGIRCCRGSPPRGSPRAERRGIDAPNRPRGESSPVSPTVEYGVCSNPTRSMGTR